MPTTHLIQVVRPLVAGQDLAVLEALGHVSYVAVLGPIAFVIAYFRLKTRLFD